MSNFAKFILLLSIGLVLALVSIWLIGGKNREYDTKVAINARASQIFPYLVDSDLKKEWIQGFVEQELIGESPVEEGSELRTIHESNGKTIEATGSVIRFAENEIISIRSNSHGTLLTSIFKLKEINKKTEVEYRLIVRAHGLNRFTTVFSEDEYRKEIERDMNNLVKRVENKYPYGWDASIDTPPTAGVNIDGGTSAGEPESAGDADQRNADGSTTDGSNGATESGGT